jgi:hypothetical protein
MNPIPQQNAEALSRGLAPNAELQEGLWTEEKERKEADRSLQVHSRQVASFRNVRTKLPPVRHDSVTGQTLRMKKLKSAHK